jgi:hypothetical protein
MTWRLRCTLVLVPPPVVMLVTPACGFMDNPACGTQGLTGLAAAALGAEVFLTDQAQILFLAHENAARCNQDLGDAYVDHRSMGGGGPGRAARIVAIHESGRRWDYQLMSHHLGT